MIGVNGNAPLHKVSQRSTVSSAPLFFFFVHALLKATNSLIHVCSVTRKKCGLFGILYFWDWRPSQPTRRHAKTLVYPTDQTAHVRQVLGAQRVHNQPAVVPSSRALNVHWHQPLLDSPTLLALDVHVRTGGQGRRAMCVRAPALVKVPLLLWVSHWILQRHLVDRAGRMIP